MGRLKLFLPLIIFLLLAVFLLRGLDRDPTAMPSALIDKPVPDFSLVSLSSSDLLPNVADGDTLNRNAVLLGKPALLNVWATWCMPCRVEHPFLMNLADLGVPVLGVNYKDDSRDAKTWLQDMGNPYYAVIADSDGRLGIDLGVFGAPETYLVDAKGIIRYKHVGILDGAVWRKDFAPIYRQLLAESEGSPSQR